MSSAADSARYRARHPERRRETQAKYRASTKGQITEARAGCKVAQHLRALETHEAQD